MVSEQVELHKRNPNHDSDREREYLIFERAEENGIIISEFEMSQLSIFERYEKLNELVKNECE